MKFSYYVELRKEAVEIILIFKIKIKTMSCKKLVVGFFMKQTMKRV